MTNVDTLWYHLPDAARFVQDGSITPLHFFDLETVTAFYPATSELIHGLGILLMGNDVLSPVINFGWLALRAVGCVVRGQGLRRTTHHAHRGRCIDGHARVGHNATGWGIRRHCRIGSVALMCCDPHSHACRYRPMEVVRHRYRCARRWPRGRYEVHVSRTHRGIDPRHLCRGPARSPGQGGRRLVRTIDAQRSVLVRQELGGGWKSASIGALQTRAALVTQSSHHDALLDMGALHPER